MAEQFELFAPKPHPLSLIWDELPEEPKADPDDLRYYQRDQFNAIVAGFKAGAKSQLMVSATGSGKTRTFGTVAKHWNGPVLVLSHRFELIEQAQRALESITGEYVEIEKAEWTSSPRTRLVVGSVQSFNKSRLERMGRDRFALVIVDEAHHFLAKTWRKVVEHFACPRLGVTATPDRGDEQALGQLFDQIVTPVMDLWDCIEAGYLVPVKTFEVTLKEVDLDKVSVTKGDFTVGELDEEMLKGVGGIVHETLKFDSAGSRQAVCFFPGVRSAEFAAQQFNLMKPGSAGFVSGELRTRDPMQLRQTMNDFREGRLQYLCNCQLITEGVDVPPASLIVQGRPTKSRALAAQMTGRGTRPIAGVVDSISGRDGAAARRAAIGASSKPDCVVLHFSGNSRHSLMTPEDILGGTFTSEEIEYAKKKRKEEGSTKDARQALLEAREGLERIARSARVKSVQSVVREFDPFRVFGMSLGDEQRYASRFGLKPASEKQLAFLRRAGMPEEDLSGLSKTAAKRLMDKIFGRRQHGLANYQQMRILQKWGITQQNVRFDRANDAVAYITRQGVNGRPVDPGWLQELVTRSRDAGDG